jgi:predicted unusual protein kinase regulating ubiquinone biosynthesis (AarF/ABC1/UbiB family)
VDFGIVGKLDGETTDSLRYFAQSLFAGHAGRAIDEFLQFLTPSRRTDLAAARRDLMEAMKSYVESARVSPQELVHSEEIFEIEMLSLVRKHRMALSPDAARYLKAVLTAEATVKELDPDFDLAEHENRFFGRLMLLETRESLSPRRIAQWLLDARFRVRNVLSSLEGLRSAPGHVVSVARDVRRRVQTISLLAILGWGTVLAMTWAGGGEILGFSFRSIALVGAAASLLLLIFSLREVRRLPSESDPPRIGQYPRRVR